MKIAMWFNLPEDQEDFDRASRAGRAERVLEDLDEELRRLWKYENKETIKIDQLRKIISDLKNEYDVP
jgi:thymidylate synthase